METILIKVNPKRPNRGRLRQAARVIQEGGLVAFPTETVYGLGCDWKNAAARNRLYRIKERPKDKPLSVHIAKRDDLKELKVVLDEDAEKLIAQFWPGPLTLIFPTSGGDKIGVRLPDNRVAQSLIAGSKTFLLAPSANISGGAPATEAEEVARIFSGKIEAIVDGGKSALAEASTVVDLTTHPFRVKRQGALAFSLLKDILGKKILKETNILLVCTGNSCRSAMAEGYLRGLLKGRNCLTVSSCGTAALKGSPPTAEAIAVMREEGIDISPHQARRLSAEIVGASDLILVMEGLHRDIILEEYPRAKKKVYLLREYGINNPQGGHDIPDPIGQPLMEYRRIFKIIKEALERIAKKI